MIDNILIGKLEIKCRGWVDGIDFFFTGFNFSSIFNIYLLPTTKCLIQLR